MKALIVDFNDSFTFNLSGLLNDWKILHDVLHFKDVNLIAIKENKYSSVIWGPGPGHPNEYLDSEFVIKELFKLENIYQIGVCLGHQLILKAKGLEIIEAPIKRHGRRGSFKVPRWDEFDSKYYGEELLVQYYSSLAVAVPESNDPDIEMVHVGGVIDSSKSSKHLSFQFHPESVGTSCPEVFFHKWRSSLIQ